MFIAGGCNCHAYQKCTWSLRIWTSPYCGHAVLVPMVFALQGLTLILVGVVYYDGTLPIYFAQELRVFQRGLFLLSQRKCLYRSKCKCEVFTGEWNLKAQGNYNCQIQIQPIFLPIFLGHFEAILLISVKFSSYVYAIESVSLWMGRAVKIGSQNQVMYIYHRVGWSKL